MLQYIIWEVNPEIFHVGSFSVRWYGLLFALGFLIGMQIMGYIFKKEDKPVADTDTLLIYMVVSTILGARFGHFLFYEPDVLLHHPLTVITPPFAGLASHGATIGILIGPVALLAPERKPADESNVSVGNRPYCYCRCPGRGLHSVW